MSKLKAFLRVVEVVAGCALLTAMALVLLVKTQLMSPATAQPVVVALVCAVLPVWGTLVVLLGELARVRWLAGRPLLTPFSWSAQARLANEEAKLLFDWCPRSWRFASLVAAAVAIVPIVGIGKVEWSPGQEFTQAHALGFSAIAAFFSAMAFPTFASASRMPGQYSDHVSRRWERS